MKNLNLNHLFWLGALGISVGTTIGAYQLLTFRLVPRHIETMAATYPLVHIHVFLGLIWMLSGLLQFLPFSLKNKTLHRKIGYTYIASCLVSNVLTLGHSFYLQDSSPFKSFNIPHSTHTSVCVIIAIYFIKKRNLEKHRAWMIRSFIMVLSMPLTRLLGPASIYLGLPRIPFRLQAYILFIIAELIIHRKTDINIFGNGPKWARILSVLLLFSFFFACIVLTFIGEYHFLNTPGIINIK